MPLAPLRPRRRHKRVHPDISRPSAATSATPNLSTVAERIAGLIDGPVGEALVGILTELYGDGLAQIMSIVRAGPDGASTIERLCDDPLVAGLLVVHDLHPHPLRSRVERAIASVAPPHVDAIILDRIEDDVVYVRLPQRGGVPVGESPLQSAVVRAIAQAAPEISRVSADVGGFGHPAIAYHSAPEGFVSG